MLDEWFRVSVWFEWIKSQARRAKQKLNADVALIL